MGRDMGAQVLIERHRTAAAAGDPNACYDLGMVYSSGTGGVAIDLVAAHKWFNLAAVAGLVAAAACRSEVAEEMTAREIAEAQRQARAWLALTTRRAA